MAVLPLALSALIFFSFVAALSGPRLNRRWPLLDRLIASFVLTCSQIVVTELLLGWLGLLYRWPLVAANVVASGLLFYLAQSRAATLFGELTALTRSLGRLLREFPTIAFMASWVALLVIYLVGVDWVLPTTDWDSLRYHLPIVAQMIQQHGIMEVPTDTVFINTYPKNFELMFLWWMLLSGSDQWVNATQIPFFLIALAIVYRLARLTDLSRHHSLLGALLLASAPVMLQQLMSTMIDVMFSTMAILAAWGLYRFVRGGEPFDLLLSGLAAGLAAGGKGNGVVWPVILGILVIVAVLVRGQGHVRGHWLRPVLYFGLPAFLLSFHWYAKNWWVYGNPIEPYQLTVLGQEVFKGDVNTYKYLILEKLENLSPRIIENLPDERPPSDALEAVWYAWHEPLFLFRAFGKMGGLGSPWFILLLPALPVAALLAWFTGRRTLWWLYAALLPPFLLFITHQWITRYGLFVLALGIVAFVTVLDELPRLARPLRIAALVLFMVSSAHGSLNKDATPGKLRMYLALSPGERLTRAEGPYSVNHGTRELMRWWRGQDTEESLLRYHTEEWIFTYPLWNPQFSNRVEYIPKVTDYENWRLAAAPSDWLLLSKGSPEAAWTEMIGTYQKAYDDGSFVVYRNAR
jgi:hypothetical protein